MCFIGWNGKRYYGPTASKVGSEERADDTHATAQFGTRARQERPTKRRP